MVWLLGALKVRPREAWGVGRQRHDSGSRVHEASRARSVMPSTHGISARARSLRRHCAIWSGAGAAIFVGQASRVAQSVHWSHLIVSRRPHLCALRSRARRHPYNHQAPATPAASTTEPSPPSPSTNYRSIAYPLARVRPRSSSAAPIHPAQANRPKTSSRARGHISGSTLPPAQACTPAQEPASRKPASPQERNPHAETPLR